MENFQKKIFGEASEPSSVNIWNQSLVSCLVSIIGIIVNKQATKQTYMHTL